MKYEKKYAWVDERTCVGCGCCGKVCPRKAINVPEGIFAVVDRKRCIGCGLCAQACPASVIMLKTHREGDREVPSK